MGQQNELVRDLKSMSEDSRKIIEDITVIEAEIERYQDQIGVWIKTVTEMEVFVNKVTGLKESYAKRCKGMAKLRNELMGDQKVKRGRR